MSFRVTPVLANQTATMPVEGGWRRKSMPTDGLLIEADETTLFIPEADVVEALNELVRARRKAGR